MTKSKTKKQPQVRIIASDELARVQGGVEGNICAPRDASTGLSTGVISPRDSASGMPTGIVSPRDAASGLPTG